MSMTISAKNQVVNDSPRIEVRIMDILYDNKHIL